TIDPISYLFTSVASVGVLGFADPEIRYPAGTEVLLQFDAPLITAREYERTVPQFEQSRAEKIERLVRQLPFRTATKGSHKPSDLTNLVFIGSPEGLKRAFDASGWVQVDELSAASKFMTLKTLGGNQVYTEAPMSTLLLDERPPVFTLSKTTNSF